MGDNEKCWVIMTVNYINSTSLFIHQGRITFDSEKYV